MCRQPVAELQHVGVARLHRDGGGGDAVAAALLPVDAGGDGFAADLQRGLGDLHGTHIVGIKLVIDVCPDERIGIFDFVRARTLVRERLRECGLCRQNGRQRQGDTKNVHDWDLRLFVLNAASLLNDAQRSKWAQCRDDPGQ
jgi:hypothetical protein